MCLFLRKLDLRQLTKSSAFSFCFLIIFAAGNLFAAIKIPNGLNQESRKEFLKQVGFSSAYKYLAQGYILGGYDGLELSSSVENIPFSKANYLSQTPINETDKILQSIIIGKGLYQNVDFFFSFSPFLLQNQISSYGASLRYIFYVDEDRPFNLGFLFHGNGLNFSNLVGIQTTGMDLVANYYLNYWTLYFGVGTARSLASFVGGSNGVTSDQIPADEDLYQNRFYGGVSYNFGSYALTFQVDRVYIETFSAKLGTRF